MLAILINLGQSMWSISVMFADELSQRWFDL